MTASVKIDIAEDTLLVGIAASPGIAISKSHLVNRAKFGAIERRITPSEIDAEIAAFRDSVAISKTQLIDIKSQAQNQLLSDHLYIIDTHLLILEDEMLINETEGLIKNQSINAEAALNRTLRKLRRAFDSIEDEYLRERRSDIDSVGDRIMRNLLGELRDTLNDLRSQVIVVAHDLSPGDTVQMDKNKVIGFVTDVGGRTSHTAILARSLGIPAVVGLETVTSVVPDGLPMIVDGTTGQVILNPSEETFREYLEKKQRYEYLEKELEKYRDLPSETWDGHHVSLRGNVDFVEEVTTARLHGAEGVGLFRTEFLFMTNEGPPSEEEQFRTYRQAAEYMAPHPVTIRTLDVGGDKFVPELNLDDEANPVMGLRAVRFSLKEIHLFHSQLRAILRAAQYGNIRVMFPMVSGVAEIVDCKQFLDKVRNELLAEGVPVPDHVDVGVMIETPSAVLIADLLAREVDFFSVGTNDLIQYCLAIDRGNEHVAYLYQPMHPAVLRALHTICKAARDAGIEVAMCGEMAGEQIYCMVLVALGFNELSMNPVSISRVKRVLSQVSMDESLKLLEKLLTFSTADQIVSALEQEMKKRFPEIFELTQI